MPTTQNIVIDLNTRGATPVAFTHQGDTARTFVFEVYNNGEEFDVSSYSVKVAALLPADNGYYVIAGENMATGDTYGNTITVTLPAEYTQKFGNGVLTLVLTGSGATIRPINIDLRIQKSADAPETIAGASDFVPVLQRYMAEDMQTYINAWLDAHPEAMQYYISGSKLVLDSNGILSIENDTDDIIEALDLDTLRSEVTDLKSDLTATFNYINEALGGIVVSGSYIKTDGTTDTLNNMYYMGVPVVAGGHYKITGTAWYSVTPYVFVASDNTIVYPTIPSPGRTVTQYSDMEFTPQKSGTLYVNWHRNNSHGVTQTLISRLKEESAPNDILEPIEFTKLSSTLTNYKSLNGTTGVVSDSNNSADCVTNAITVTGGKTYLINTQNFYSQGLYAFYDANMNFISGRASNAGATMTLMEFEEVTAPKDATYLIVGLWSQTIFSNVYVAEGSARSIFPSKRWNGLKWACVGDSLTGASIHDFRHYFNFVAEHTGISLEIMGVGGTGYARGSESNNAFYQRVSALPVDTDVVTIFGSFNDLSSTLPIGTADDSTTDTIGGCVNTTISNIVAVIPTANIGIVAPCPWGTTRPSTSGNAFDYVELLKAVAEKWSIPFLDLWRQSGLRPWDTDFASEAYPSGDTVHPNEVGHAILAPKFKAFLDMLLL